jgi:uncharacterized membrane protein YphA (DoxX/SURF4 family)
VRHAVDAAVLVVAATFIVAGVAKISRRRNFMATLEAMGLHAAVRSPLSAFLPIFEVALGIALLVPDARRIASAAAATLLAVFTLAMSRFVSARVPMPCACFGGSAIVDLGLVVRNVILFTYVASAALLGPESGTDIWNRGAAPFVILGSVALIPFVLSLAIRMWTDADGLFVNASSRGARA